MKNVNKTVKLFGSVREAGSGEYDDKGSWWPIRVLLTVHSVEGRELPVHLCALCAECAQGEEVGPPKVGYCEGCYADYGLRARG